MTTERYDPLDVFVKRHDPALRIDPQMAARVSRAVLSQIAVQRRPGLAATLRDTLVGWHALPRYAASLALGLALGAAVGASGRFAAADAPTVNAARLYAQVQPLTPLGL